MTIGEFIKKYHRLPKISNPTPECPKELIDNRKVKQSCRTCKFAPPSKKWPCEDCDMTVYDRWELNDYYSGYAKGYSDGKEQTTENYENEKKYLRLFDPKKLSQCPLYSVSEDGRGQCKLLDESPEDTPLAKDQSCGDAISREVVIQALNKMDRYTANELTLCDTDKKFPANEVFIVDDVYEQITEQLPPVTQKSGKWIPVSERLPEDGTYLVTLGRVVGGAGIDIRSFTQDLNKVDEFDFSQHKSGWYDYDSEWGYWEDTDVIAWMPLPKPYEPQESDE